MSRRRGANWLAPADALPASSLLSARERLPLPCRRALSLSRHHPAGDAMVTASPKLCYQALSLGHFCTLLRPSAIFSILCGMFARLIKLGDGILWCAVRLILVVVL
jgi:hypothetical protein